MESQTGLGGALRGVLDREEGLTWAYLFGSALAGDGYRDVDVAVMPAEGA